MASHTPFRCFQSPATGQGRVRTLLCTTALAGLLAVLPVTVRAQTVTGPGSLTAVTGTTPASGSSWTLEGSGINLDTTVTLPAGGTLSITGDGNPLTLNNGAATPAYGRFSIGAGGVTLSLSDVTFTGGNYASGSGGLLNIVES